MVSLFYFCEFLRRWTQKQIDAIKDVTDGYRIFLYKISQHS